MENKTAFLKVDLERLPALVLTIAQRNENEGKTSRYSVSSFLGYLIQKRFGFDVVGLLESATGTELNHYFEQHRPTEKLSFKAQILAIWQDNSLTAEQKDAKIKELCTPKQ